MEQQRDISSVIAIAQHDGNVRLILTDTAMISLLEAVGTGRIGAELVASTIDEALENGALQVTVEGTPLGVGYTEGSPGGTDDGWPAWQAELQSTYELLGTLTEQYADGLLVTEDGREIREGESLTLDVMYAEGETIQDAIGWLVKHLDVTATVVQEHGPGGGWPMVRFEGSLEHLRALVKRYNGLV